MEEIWKDIQRCAPYIVSNKGIIKNKETGEIKHQSIVKGYYMVSLKGKSYYVHRVVAKAFIKNPNIKEFTKVNHKDENRLNNNIENLEWCTSSYNSKYGTCQQRKTEKLSKCKVIQYDSKGNIIKIWDSRNILRTSCHAGAWHAIVRNSFNRYFNDSYWFTEYEKFDINRRFERRSKSNNGFKIIINNRKYDVK